MNATLDLPLSACAPNVEPKIQMLAAVMSERVQAAVQRELQNYVSTDPMSCDVSKLLQMIGNWQPGKDWQDTYALMYDTVHAVLKQRGVHDAPIAARDVVICIAEMLGGTNVYLPTLEPIRTAVRDSMIYTMCGTFSAAELSKRFELTEGWIYQIIEAQRVLRRPQQSQIFEQVAA